MNSNEIRRVGNSNESNWQTRERTEISKRTEGRGNSVDWNRATIHHGLYIFQKRGESWRKMENYPTRLITSALFFILARSWRVFAMIAVRTDRGID